MNFAVPFLKMLTLYILWKAQFLLDFYAIFSFHQILILLPLSAKIQEEKVSQKVRIGILLLAIIQDEKKIKFQPLDYTRSKKVQYLLNESKDPCKDPRTRVVNTVEFHQHELLSELVQCCATSPRNLLHRQAEDTGTRPANDACLSGTSIGFSKIFCKTYLA